MDRSRFMDGMKVDPSKVFAESDVYTAHGQARSGRGEKLMGMSAAANPMLAAMMQRSR